MPNHVTNSLKIIGCQGQINQVMEFIKSDEVEETNIRTMDFNKITPMPPVDIPGKSGKRTRRKIRD